MKPLKRNRIFELLGAKPKNPRWSWCALSSNRRGAVFTIWEDEIHNGRSRLSWPQVESKGGPGAKEKQRILETVMKENIPVYGLVCVAVDPSSSPRSIKSVEGEFLVRLQIEREGESIYGKHIGEVYILDAKQEIAGRGNDDALQDLDDVPSGNAMPDRAAKVEVSFVRDPKVRAYVLQLANGRCEYCDQLSFKMMNGQHFVEAHHIIALSADGKDTVANVIALCPNHHREAHYGVEAEILEAKFIDCVKARNKTHKTGKPLP